MQMADIWSCGIILYAMLFGRYPFNARERDYARKIVSAQYVLPSDVPVSAECADLLTRVLVADPHVRLSMDDIKRHPWFNQDLPGGALQMNNFYLQAPPFLDMVRACRCDAALGLLGWRFHWVCAEKKRAGGLCLSRAFVRVLCWALAACAFRTRPLLRYLLLCRQYAEGVDALVEQAQYLGQGGDGMVLLGSSQ